LIGSSQAIFVVASGPKRISSGLTITEPLNRLQPAEPDAAPVSVTSSVGIAIASIAASPIWMSCQLPATSAGATPGVSAGAAADVEGSAPPGAHAATAATRVIASTSTRSTGGIPPGRDDRGRSRRPGGSRVRTPAP